MKEILATVYTGDGDKVTAQEFDSIYSIGKLVDSAFELGCMVIMEKAEPEEKDEEAQA